MDETKTYRTSRKCWVVLLACCLTDAVGFTIGTTLFSVFLTPMKTAMELTMTQAQIYNTTCMACTIISTFFGDKFMRMGAGKMVAIMAAAEMIGYNLMGFFPSVATMAIAGCLGGIAYPLLSIYTVPVIVGNWFHSRQGTWISIGVACSGLGGLILSPFSTSLIATFGWQRALSLTSLVCLIPLLCGIFIIRENPLDQGILPHGATLEDLEKDKEEKDAAKALELPGLTLKEALHSPAFYILAVSLFCIGITSGYAGNMNPIIQAAGYSATTAAAGLSAMSLGNLFCKPILGIMRDRLGAVLSGICGYMCLIIGFACILFSTAIGNTTFIIVTAFITGLGGGAGLIMPSLYTKDALGSKDFDRIYSIQMGIRACGCAVAAPLAGVMFDASGGYTTSIVMWMCAAAVIFIFGFIAVKLGRRAWGGSPKILGRPDKK